MCRIIETWTHPSTMSWMSAHGTEAKIRLQRCSTYKLYSSHNVLYCVLNPCPHNLCFTLLLFPVFFLQSYEPAAIQTVMLIFFLCVPDLHQWNNTACIFKHKVKIVVIEEAYSREFLPSGTSFIPTEYKGNRSDSTMWMWYGDS